MLVRAEINIAVYETCMFRYRSAVAFWTRWIGLTPRVLLMITIVEKLSTVGDAVCFCRDEGVCVNV